MGHNFRKIADLWIGRRARHGHTVKAARDAVAHLKPIAVITGGSRGIGAALALEFAREGYDVALIARDAGALTMTAARIGIGTGRNAMALPLDITLADAPLEIEQALAARGYYAHILVNNAGIGLSGLFERHTPVEIDQLVAINMAAPTRLMLHTLAAMKARQQGGILNIASLGGYAPGPYQAAYYASKAYILSLTEAVAAEVAGLGVRVTVVAPGPIETGFHASMSAENARYRKYLPSMTPEAVARRTVRGFLLGRRVIVPGALNSLLFAALKLMPHAITVPIVAWLLASGKPK
jgi:uncharacterized protein